VICEEVWVTIHRSIDRCQTIRCCQDQRRISASECGAQSSIDLSHILAKTNILAFGAVNATAWASVVQSRFSDGTGSVTRQPLHLHLRWGQIWQDLDQAHCVLRRGQNVGRMREGNRTKKWVGHCQSKFFYFAKTSEPDFAAIDFPAFSGSI
jgi:hypothetical protein